MPNHNNTGADPINPSGLPHSTSMVTFFSVMTINIFLNNLELYVSRNKSIKPPPPTMIEQTAPRALKRNILLSSMPLLLATYFLGLYQFKGKALSSGLNTFATAVLFGYASIELFVRLNKPHFAKYLVPFFLLANASLINTPSVVGDEVSAGQDFSAELLVQCFVKSFLCWAPMSLAIDVTQRLFEDSKKNDAYKLFAHGKFATFSQNTQGALKLLLGKNDGTMIWESEAISCVASTRMKYVASLLLKVVMSLFLGSSIDGRFYINQGDITLDGLRKLIINNPLPFWSNIIFSSVTMPSLNPLPGDTEKALYYRLLAFWNGSIFEQLAYAAAEDTTSTEPARQADLYISYCYAIPFILQVARIILIYLSADVGLDDQTHHQRRETPNPAGSTTTALLLVNHDLGDEVTPMAPTTNP